MTDHVGMVRAAWNALNGLPRRKGGLHAYDLADDPRPVRAVLGTSGYRGMLFGLVAGEQVRIPAALHSSSGAALVCEVAPFQAPGVEGRPYVHVWCKDPSVNQAFEAFCAMLWRTAAEGEMTTALSQCSEEFRRLLAVEQDVHPRSLIGLVGELVVLRELVEYQPSLISAWTGPAGSRHDFRTGSVAAEVKTTLRSQSKDRTVKISDIDQLDPPVGGSLYLWLVRLEQAMNGALSVTALAADIRTHLDPAGESVLDGCLQKWDGQDWSKPFELREVKAYHVRDGFPRLSASMLSRGSLDPGVSNVSYSLSLESACSFEVPVNVAIEAMGEALL